MVSSLWHCAQLLAALFVLETSYPRIQNEWLLKIFLEHPPWRFRAPTKPEMRVVWRAFNVKSKASCFENICLSVSLMKTT